MSEQLTAEQVRDLLHEAAGMLGIEVVSWDPFASAFLLLGHRGQNGSHLMEKSDIDAINEGRVVDAMRSKDWVVEIKSVVKWQVVLWKDTEWRDCRPIDWIEFSEEHESRLVAILLAARAALKAEEAR